ncbi:MAG: hypothetical protein DSM106950_21530 [Stigonema ocellatum SAG 48.90 = DSM 106950]|nr:hypothetical protein [Stigonema ocellatum SAG 48.90 = DSM 106950]
MSRLTIGDLSFCETELVSNSQVLGGSTITVSSPYGTWSSSYDTAKSSNYYASYSVNRQTGEITSVISSRSEGSVAGSVAGSVSDGATKYAYSSSSAQTI